MELKKRSHFTTSVSLVVHSFPMCSSYSLPLLSKLARTGVAIDELRVQLDATQSTATVVDNIDVTASAIPEPATLALVGLALAGLAVRRRTKRDR